MEDLKQQEQIINLGKLLVKELSLENSVDTLSRWMAHYVADRIVQVEKLPQGKEKDAAEKVCFQTILKLWEHRWLLPSGKRPLENFESIFAVLEKINPENEGTFFYRNPVSLLEKSSGNGDLKDISIYMDAVYQIDKIARIWIDYLLKQAAFKAKNEDLEGVLENKINIFQSLDIETIRVLLDENDGFEEKSKRETLQKRIEELDKFAQLNKLILEKYKERYNMENPDLKI